MEQLSKRKAVALLTRELQEYRNSFVLTPVAVAGLFIVFMLASVLLANRITVAADSVVDILHEEHSRGGMNITIVIDDDNVPQDYVVTDESVAADAEYDEWNFSREWKFNPQRREKQSPDLGKEIESINPLLNAVHCFFLLLLLVTSINYLLGTFHQDRRDRSVLFWKSLPVSEGQEVAAKMVTVCLLAPAIYVALSVFTQLATVLLTMLTVWRMDMNPGQIVLGNINFFSLFRGQFFGLLIWVLWTAPFYAWLLLSSSAARRSPLLLALAIPLALIILEQLFIGSDHVSTAITQHIPHPGDQDSTPLGFYFNEPKLQALDFTAMVLGLVVTAGFLFGTIWFRKHRFEL